MRTFIFVHFYLFDVRFWGMRLGSDVPKRGTNKTVLQTLDLAFFGMIWEASAEDALASLWLRLNRGVAKSRFSGNKGSYYFCTQNHFMISRSVPKTNPEKRKTYSSPHIVSLSTPTFLSLSNFSPASA
jgi:hypothetical protein